MVAGCPPARRGSDGGLRADARGGPAVPERGAAEEIVFTPGPRRGMNLVAQAWGGADLQAGDEVVLTVMEHHSNIVPWQMVAHRTGAVFRVVPLRADGAVDLEAYRSLVTARTRVVALSHVSNVLGTVTPIVEMAAWRIRSAPSWWWTGPSRCPTCRWMSGRWTPTSRLLGPQAVRPHGDGGAVRQAGAARADAALADRWRHDRDRDFRGDHLGAAARPVRGRHPAHRRASSAWGGHRVPGRPGHRCHRGPRGGAPGLRDHGAGRGARAPAVRFRARETRGALVRAWGDSPARPRHHPGCRRASRSGRGTIVPSR